MSVSLLVIHQYLSQAEVRGSEASKDELQLGGFSSEWSYCNVSFYDELHPMSCFCNCRKAEGT